MEELQVEVVVMFWVLPSLKWPVAVNCCIVPAGMLTVGVTVIEVSVTLVPTVKVVDAWTVPRLALIELDPLAMAVASPV